MVQAERDGSNEYSNYQPGSLNTTDQLIKDLENIDIVFHIGDITYANGYISQWDQFTSQVEPIASTVPYMIGRFACLQCLSCFACIYSNVLSIKSCYFLELTCSTPAVAIMNAMCRGQDPSMTLMIQVVNVVCLLRPCFMFLLKIELSFGK